MVAGSRSKGRPSLLEAVEIDRAIRDAGMKVLLEQGEAATLNAVARAAGLSRKSVYARYPNKAALFLEITREQLLRAAAISYDTTGSLEQRLLNYITAALAVIATPSAQVFQRLLSMDPGFVGALRQELLLATRKLFFDPLRDLLARARDDGEIAVDDPDAAASLLVKLIFADAATSQERTESWLRPMSNHPQFLTRMVLWGLVPRD